MHYVQYLRVMKKYIAGYGTAYSVNKIGQVFSKVRGLLGTDKSRTGYLRVALSKNGKTKRFLVHRLVAIAYIPNPENKKQVNHKDGNKQNNAVENLEWCTISENAQHAFATGLRFSTDKQKEAASKTGLSKGKSVLQFDLRGNFIAEYSSTQEAGRQTKIAFSGIAACCRGEKLKHRNYVWTYDSLKPKRELNVIY